MTLFFLTRHGETVWHADNRYAGVTDVALTARGDEQAQGLGAWAARSSLTAIWSSPQSRALQTAAPGAAATGLAVNTDTGLREVDFGLAEGRTFAEVRELDAEAADAFVAAPAHRPFPGGERGVDAAERALAALRRISEREPDGRVLVVGHSTTTRLLLCALLGIELDRYRTVFPAVGNCSVTELRFEREAALLSFNVAMV